MAVRDREVEYVPVRRRSRAGAVVLIIVVLALVAIATFFALGGRVSVNDPGDVNVEQPDVDVQAPDVDVDPAGREEAPTTTTD